MEFQKARVGSKVRNTLNMIEGTVTGFGYIRGRRTSEIRVEAMDNVNESNGAYFKYNEQQMSIFIPCSWLEFI